MQMSPTISIIMDRRRCKSTGNYPVKLRITFLRQQKYHPTGFALSTEDFDLMRNCAAVKILDAAAKRRIKEAKLRSDTILMKATTIIGKMEDFTFRQFEKRFYQHQLSTKDVYHFYDAAIDQMKAEGRVGTGSNYRSSMRSLQTFRPGLPLEIFPWSFSRNTSGTS